MRPFQYKLNRKMVDRSLPRHSHCQCLVLTFMVSVSGQMLLKGVVGYMCNPRRFLRFASRLPAQQLDAVRRSASPRLE